jgi:hypothetical protein
MIAQLAVVIAAAACVMYWHREIAQAIRNFKDNFPRGGPPSPMHPSPAGDHEFLRTKPRASASPRQ